MDRRLYFLIPDRQHALAVVDELAARGIQRDHMHAVGDPRTRLDDLPRASVRQKNDSGRRLEKILWNTNIASFCLALAALIIIPVFYGFTWWLLAPVGIMASNFMLGLHLTTIPDTHLVVFRDALAHGEILLMVDVPESQVAEIERDIHHRHPEAAVGGVGWGTQAFGL